MGKNGKKSFFLSFAIKLIAAFTIVLAVVIGAGLGFSIAETANIRNQENFREFAPALPTRILDVNGILITEFSADERRELVSVNELPRHLINAVLVREDVNFFNHRGFCLRGTGRAVFGQLTGRNLGGGSTITQQVAGTLFTNRRERTVQRKVRELWWAFQMERRHTKNEILEIYLNYMYMGSGTFGVEAASRHFFGHSARDVTLAEAALLSVLFSSPNRFNPLNNPNVAMDRQRFVLDRMVELGFAGREEADASFREHWDNFDFTRAPVAAFFTREDQAPWFSEHVRRELEGLMYGTMDFNRDGFTVHTTLNLLHQESAQRFMEEGLARANRVHEQSRRGNISHAERIHTPIVNMLTLLFDLTDISATAAGQSEQRAISRYVRTINPIVDMMGLAFGIPELKDITTPGFAQLQQNTARNVVEGALITIENETGHITAIIGGSRFGEGNQFIRATQASVQPGSAFKPLYYSAALDRNWTAASLIFDVPVVFHNEDGTPYIPFNFRGEWHGPVLLFHAMARSMNIPSLKILENIGFDAAIGRAAALLDITNPAQIRRTFPRVYPLGLGVSSHSPISMARAYAVFANQGRAVTPISIRHIEDRNGRLIMDLERDLRRQQRRMGSDIQVITPQNAYVMNRILERVIASGGWSDRFVFRDDDGRNFRMPMAGKTGTTQNWADAWMVGYSPYYTTAVWFGFDSPGNSLGVELTGHTLSGAVWANYMQEIHRGLPRRDFTRPATGIVDVTVCRLSGFLRNPSCDAGAITLPFIEGTRPTQLCNMCGPGATLNAASRPPSGVPLGGFSNDVLNSLSLPTLQLDLLLPEINIPPRAEQNDVSVENPAAQPAAVFTDIMNAGQNPTVTEQAAPQAIEPEQHNIEVFSNQTFESQIFDRIQDGGLPSWNPLE